MSSGVTDDSADFAQAREAERTHLVRIVRQRLESLSRAGLDRIGLPIPIGRIPAKSLLTAPVAARVTPPAARVPASPLPPTAPIASPIPGLPVSVAGVPVGRVSLPTAPPAAPRSLFAEPKLEAAVPLAERELLLTKLASEVATCVRCPLLASTRTQTVFGEGSPTARLMFVGEAPGADEDASGRPFVGRAGALLTDMITKGMGLTRDEVYIANVLKSRPPENRTPEPVEIGHCLPYLEEQIRLIRPEFLCLLGKTAASALLETALPLGRLRGKWHRYRDIPTIVTYHPSALLRNPAWKKDAWADLQALMLAMGVKSPERKKT